MPAPMPLSLIVMIEAVAMPLPPPPPAAVPQGRTTAVARVSHSRRCTRCGRGPAWASMARTASLSTMPPAVWRYASTTTCAARSSLPASSSSWMATARRSWLSVRRAVMTSFFSTQEWKPH